MFDLIGYITELINYITDLIICGCCKKYAFWWFVLALVAIGITLSLVFGLGSHGRFRKQCKHIGAVTSNASGCAEVGGHILDMGGSAADAAIATLLCEGVMLPHSLGIGGGFVATIYSKKTGKIESLIARETAPSAATRDMFIERRITGAIAAAVPSEIYGYWRLHDRYGKLPWCDLFTPAIELCRNGILVSQYLGNVLASYEQHIRNEPTMAEIFINPRTHAIYKEGETMYRHALANTLEIVAQEGPEALYRGGQLGQMLVEDIQAMGGIITEQDLMNYDVRWEPPLVARFTGGFQLFTTPLPSSGAVLTFILNVMAPLYTPDHNVYWQRLIETFKHAYGYRTKLGDIHYEPQVQEMCDKLVDPAFAAEIRKLIRDGRTYYDLNYYDADFASIEDQGTAHISVLAPDGDAISVTSTVNSHLGAKVRSPRTGIILNDEMDDFSTPGTLNAYNVPASPANYIKPGKCPLSSTCPSIVLDRYGDVKLLVGGAGGTKITTSMAQTILRYFVLGESLEQAINAGRMHHQLSPMHIDVEPEVPEHTRRHLQRIGHQLNYLPGDKAFSALTAIGLMDTEPQPVCDRRRVGSAVVVRKTKN